MRLNYKPIGDYIKRLKVKNNGASFTRLLGININKYFMPSVANIVGTDLSRYLIVEPRQFACNRMHVGRDYRLPVALSNETQPFIISPAYDVFKIKDESQLLPEYLMMWFSRAEFDRNSWFHTDTDVRGKLGWDSLCEMELPVPSIEKQREIVKEYNVIANRIKLNEKINQKLEETAQAIYKHWFVDFEFPNENRKPYASSGGKMVYNEELDKEIPEGWAVKKLDEIASISAGGDKPKLFSAFETGHFKIPVYSNSSNNNGLFGFATKAKVTKKSITISARGAIIGFTKMRVKPFYPIVRLIVVTPNIDYDLNYLFFYLDNLEFDSAASAQGQLTVPEISFFEILHPSTEILKNFNDIYDKILEKIDLKEIENHELLRLITVLLSKIAIVDITESTLIPE